ncbi:MAG: NADH-quinone oxidoreductase subunit L [Acidimicrobiia bacterium]
MKSNFLHYSWLIPVLPALSACFILIFGKRLKEIYSAVLATLVMGSTFVLWVLSFIAMRSIKGEEIRRMVSSGYTWMQVGNFKVDLRFMVDPLSITMVGFITFVATLIHIYSIGYMKGDPRYSRFFAYLNLFAGAMLTLVLGENLLVTFLGWEGVGLCSYLLISFWFEKPSAATAGKKAFVTNRVGDVGFMLAMFLIVVTPALGSLSYSDIQEKVGTVPTVSATAIVLLLFVGAMGKSAQFPLHIWLPDAMEGPTPVSALIHAATMVTAGVFVMVRMSPLISEASPVAGNIIAVIGLITALYAAICALTQNDIKRVLAYSTISQLGYTFLAIGVGAYSAAMFHVVTHAFFKALLFLGSGSVIHAMHGVGHEHHIDEQDMRFMGGLKKLLPLTSITFIFGWLAIAGVFPFAGFWSKDEILGSAFAKGGSFGFILWIVGLLTALLTAFYMTRQVRMVFFGNKRYPDGEHTPHESSKTMMIPLIILSFFALVAGLINIPLHNREDFKRFLEPAIHGAKEIDVSSFNDSKGVLLAAISLIVALIAIALAYSLYKKRPKDAQDEPLEKLGPIYSLSHNAFFVNSAVAKAVSGPGLKLSNFFAFIVDNKFVDGAFMSLARGSKYIGGQLSKIQSGYVRRYVIIFTGSAFVFVLLAVLGAMR